MMWIRSGGHKIEYSVEKEEPNFDNPLKFMVWTLGRTPDIYADKITQFEQYKIYFQALCVHNFIWLVVVLEH